MEIEFVQATPEGFARFETALAEIPDIQAFKRDFAQTHFYKGIVLNKAGKACARAALYRNPHLTWENAPAATMGAYACCDDDAAAKNLLEAALEVAKTELPECRSVIGPMDGSTWEHYRFAMPAPAPPYILEPANPAWYPRQWQDNGFQVLNTYRSNAAEFGAEQHQDVDAARQYFEAKGLTFRHFDPKNAALELERLADFNLAAFHDAFLITPIDRSVFIQKYEKIVPLLRPELIWIAEDAGRVCGLFFALPDYLDASKSTAVVKTLARLPDARYKGLGEYLSALWVNTAIAHGYTRMVHALMRDDNASVRTSGRFWGETFRNYVLFVKRLG